MEKNKGKQIRVVLCSRVSPVGNVGSFLEAQIAELREYAKDNRYVIVEEIVEVAGSSLNRRGIRRIKKLASRQAMDKVIFTSLNRVCQIENQFFGFWQELEKYHVDLEMVREDLSEFRKVARRMGYAIE